MTWTIPLVFILVPLTRALVCDQPVGIEDGRIPDQNFNASTQYSRFQSAKEGRLNNVRHPSRGDGAWCPTLDDKNPHIQVDLGSVRKIAYVLTQGRNTTYDQYVKEFKVFYSTKGSIFVPIKEPLSNTAKLFPGNSNMNTILKTDIRSDPSYPINARYIRISPTKYYANPCMRIELLECFVPTSPPATTAKPACQPGYKFAADNVTCIDIDECSDGSSMCRGSSTQCINNDGGYSCQCKTGFRENSFNKYQCIDINECTETNHTCSQICNNNDGGYTCSCSNGFTLNADGSTCSDIDECAGAFLKARCSSASTTCANTVGSYKCLCLTGYERQDLYSCVDKNECRNGESQCSLQSTQCVNEPGRYVCVCKRGYERTVTQAATMPYRCLDYDECSYKNGHCSDGCQNLNGTHLCTCPAGFELQPSDRYKCRDKNECFDANGGCEEFCHNTNGSYYCACPNGFKLTQKYKCQDIDECSEGMSKCDQQTTNCRNNQPFYQCDCKAGYRAIADNKYKCEPLLCPALTKATGTTVSPSTCLQSGIPKVNDVCTFSCEPGYELPSGSSSSITCQASGAWGGPVTTCVRKSCPKLSQPGNGKVRPDFCQTRGNYYKESCYFQCNYNFNPVGDATRTCQADGTWTTPITPFSCKSAEPKPTITCPTPVTILLQMGASSADVSALLDDPKSNVKSITVSPVKYQNTKVFPAGDTTLTYTARNSLDEVVSCVTSVTVKDEEPPKIVGCPSNIYEIVNGLSKQVTWTPPTFTDNVGVNKVTSTSKPGDTFNLGPLVVYYRASDAAGNRVSCSFEVIVKKAECPAPANPDGGTISVHEFNGVKYATVRCNLGKHLFWSTWGIYCQKQTLKWDPIPDCVDSKPIPSSGICEQGSIKQTGIGSQNICVKCPRGYAYDDSKKNCFKCPVGNYSVSEGSLSCMQCPANQGTLGDGGKSCLNKCVPGKESVDGFTSCKSCRQGFYEDRYGSTACKICHNGLTTLSTGANQLSDCGVRPMITQFVAQPNNITERDPVEIICKGTGVPLPSFTVKKIKPAPDGFGGPVKKTNILDGFGRNIGLRYAITKTTEHDAGTYECKLENSFGKSVSYVALHVKLIFGPIPMKLRR